MLKSIFGLQVLDQFLASLVKIRLEFLKIMNDEKAFENKSINAAFKQYNP